jgi:hypothetical protein
MDPDRQKYESRIMENKYQDWQNSRWDYTKSKSEWHFDPKRPPLPGPDSFTHVCNFDFDFTEVIEQCMPRTVDSTWATRNKDKIPGELYSANLEQQDLIRAGADPDMEIFSRANAADVVMFKAIAEYLGIHDPSIKFHNQRTGQMLVTHIDNFAARDERDNSFIETDFDRNPRLVRRFAIMLSDWQLGQVFQLGNATWTQWKAGDCITWDWKDIPHSTCNMGWHDRPMLQITGRTTERTGFVLASASKHLVIKV